MSGVEAAERPDLAGQCYDLVGSRVGSRSVTQAGRESDRSGSHAATDHRLHLLQLGLVGNDVASAENGLADAAVSDQDRDVRSRATVSEFSEELPDICR